MTSLHPKQQPSLPSFECSFWVKSTVLAPVLFRWGKWGRVERWDQPWSSKQRASHDVLPEIPFSLFLWVRTLLGTQGKPKRWILHNSGSSESGAPRTSRRAEFLGTVQTTHSDKHQGLMLHRASASWNAFFYSLVCIGLHFPLWGCLGSKMGQLL